MEPRQTPGEFPPPEASSFTPDTIAACGETARPVYQALPRHSGCCVFFAIQDRQSSRERCVVAKLTVELTDADADLAKLVQQVGAGAEVLITQNGRPVARLVPVAETRTRARVPGSAKGLITMHADFDAPLEDFRDYM